MSKTEAVSTEWGWGGGDEEEEEEESGKNAVHSGEGRVPVRTDR